MPYLGGKTCLTPSLKVGVGQWVESRTEKAGAILTRVRVPGAACIISAHVKNPKHYTKIHGIWLVPNMSSDIRGY